MALLYSPRANPTQARSAREGTFPPSRFSVPLACASGLCQLSSLCEVANVDVTRAWGAGAGIGLLARRARAGLGQRRPDHQTMGPRLGGGTAHASRPCRLGARAGVLAGRPAPRLGKLGRD